MSHLCDCTLWTYSWYRLAEWIYLCSDICDDSGSREPLSWDDTAYPLVSDPYSHARSLLVRDIIDRREGRR